LLILSALLTKVSDCTGFFFTVVGVLSHKVLLLGLLIGLVTFSFILEDKGLLVCWVAHCHSVLVFFGVASLIGLLSSCHSFNSFIAVVISGSDIIDFLIESKSSKDFSVSFVLVGYFIYLSILDLLPSDNLSKLFAIFHIIAGFHSIDHICFHTIPHKITLHRRSGLSGLNSHPVHATAQ